MSIEEDNMVRIISKLQCYKIDKQKLFKGHKGTNELLIKEAVDCNCTFD